MDPVTCDLLVEDARAVAKVAHVGRLTGAYAIKHENSTGRHASASLAQTPAGAARHPAGPRYSTSARYREAAA